MAVGQGGTREFAAGWDSSASALIFLGVLSRFTYQWMAERFLGRVDTETIVSILAVEVAAGGVLTGAGLLLLTRAIVVAGRMPKL